MILEVAPGVTVESHTCQWEWPAGFRWPIEVRCFLTWSDGTRCDQRRSLSSNPVREVTHAFRLIGVAA